MKHAALKTLILERADTVGQTRSHNSRMLWENVGMEAMIKDMVMGLQPRDSANDKMLEDDSMLFVNFIAEFLQGVFQEDDSIELEPEYAAKLAQQAMEAIPRPPNVEVRQAWARQDAVREGSHGAASGSLRSSSGFHPVDCVSPTCAPYLSPQPKGSARVLQTFMTPQSELQQQPSLPPTRMPQKDVGADVKSTSKKSGSNRLQNKGTVTPGAAPLPVGRVCSPTLPLPVEVKPDVRSQAKQSAKGKKQNVAVPLPVGPVFPPTSLMPAAELSVATLAKLKDPPPVVPLPAKSSALSSGVGPVIRSAPVAVDTDSGSISNASWDGPVLEHPGSSLGDIHANGNITTLVIRHIPGQILQSHLMQMWPVTNIGYNLLYAPFNQRKRRSMGFAFMNFITHSALLEFHRNWNGVALADGPNSKGLEISAADVQGLEANLQRMSRSKLIKSIKRTRHLPVIVEADGNFADFRRLMAVAIQDQGGSQNSGSVQEEGEHDESMSGSSRVIESP